MVCPGCKVDLDMEFCYCGTLLWGLQEYQGGETSSPMGKAIILMVLIWAVGFLAVQLNWIEPIALFR